MWCGLGMWKKVKENVKQTIHEYWQVDTVSVRAGIDHMKSAGKIGRQMLPCRPLQVVWYTNFCEPVECQTF